MWDLALIVTGSVINFGLFRLQKGYFSIHELTTGFEERSVFIKLAKLSLPVIVGIIFSITLNYLKLGYSDAVAIGVGLFFPLYILIPLALNKELTPFRVIEQNKRTELLIILILFTTYYGFASRIGFTFGDWIIGNINGSLLPSSNHVLIDGIWVTAMIAAINCVWKKMTSLLSH